MSRWFIRYGGSAAAFVCVYYIAMNVFGYAFQVASRHDYIKSDNDIGRSILWAIGISIVLGLVAAAFVLRITKRQSR